MVGQWNVKTTTLIILGGVIFLMLLIVVLPDVDLPDTAFHRDTAPVVVHDQATAAPVAVAVAAIFQLSHVAESSRNLSCPRKPAISPHPNFGPILLCSIRC